MINPNEPLGLPKGSIRAILALETVTFCLVYFWFRGFAVPVVSLLFTVIAFYFASRTFPQSKILNEQQAELEDKNLAAKK